MNSLVAGAHAAQIAAPGCGTGIRNSSVAGCHKYTEVQRGVVVESCPLFTGILPCEYAGICSSARVREFARGEMLYMEGDSVRQVLLLTSGIVKITQLGPSGTEAILRLGVPGDILDTASIFSSGRHCATAQAFRTCKALVWEAAAFKSVVERFPVLYQNMVQVLGDHLLELEERFREVATERVAPRVARQLVRLQGKDRPPREWRGSRLVFPVTNWRK